MKNFLENLKTDKKTRNTVICSAAGAVIIIAAAIAIPVGVHSNNIKKALANEQAAQMSVSDKTDTETGTEAVSAVITEPETEETTAEVTVPTTAVPTQAANGKEDTNKGTAFNAGKGGSSGNHSGSGNSNSDTPAKKPNEGSNGSQSQNTPPAQQETPVVPAETNKKQWTQAEVDALVEETKKYAISKGLKIDNSLGIQGTSWRTPATTENAINSNEVKSRLFYLVDKSYDSVIEDFGFFVEGATVNVIAKQYTSIDGYAAWEIYVVY